MRTAGDPASAVGAVREAVRQVDPNLPLIDVSTQIEQVEQRFSQEKVVRAGLCAVWRCRAAAGSRGLFGLMSYSVARRTNEIGIRMALGARQQDVLRLVMGESMALVVAGVALGVAIALAASRLVTRFLFGLAANRYLSIAAAVLVMLCVSAIAGYLPARRASRVDPMVALHAE